MTWGLVLLGVLLGASLFGAFGALVGGALGMCAGMLTDLRKRFIALDRRVNKLEEASAWTPGPSAPLAARPMAPPVSTTPTGTKPKPSVPPPVVAEPSDEPFEPAPPSQSPIDNAIASAREFFLGGNTVVRVGVLVLLVGITLLVKWAADHEYLPIELRMACAALIGLALVIVGFRTRHSRPGFAQTLQGGGVAAMYLVIFFSFRTYGLLPAGLTFALLAVV
ncbi:MAG: DUF2339 domain-containing protein, partial [Myxococcales bacterium]|nr:DUF2339 domain-containing protein [Myxococcales bacterium]